MATKRLPRPRDPVQLGKLMVDILSGQVVDAVEAAKRVLPRSPSALADIAGYDFVSRIKLVKHSRRLHDPSIRLSFVPKVWDQAFPAAWRNHLNSKRDAPFGG
jgi:hypothetical protein